MCVCVTELRPCGCLDLYMYTILYTKSFLLIAIFRLKVQIRQSSLHVVLNSQDFADLYIY